MMFSIWREFWLRYIFWNEKNVKKSVAKEEIRFDSIVVPQEFYKEFFQTGEHAAPESIILFAKNEWADEFWFEKNVSKCFVK